MPSDTRPAKYAIGEAKLSISITQKTIGDLVVSQYGIERYFESDDATAEALEAIIGYLARIGDGHGYHPDDRAAATTEYMAARGERRKAGRERTEAKQERTAARAARSKRSAT